MRYFLFRTKNFNKPFVFSVIFFEGKKYVKFRSRGHILFLGDISRCFKWFAQSFRPIANPKSYSLRLSGNIPVYRRYCYWITKPTGFVRNLIQSWLLWTEQYDFFTENLSLSFRSLKMYVMNSNRRICSKRNSPHWKINVPKNIFQLDQKTEKMGLEVNF